MTTAAPTTWDYWEHRFLRCGHAERGPLLLAHADHMDDHAYWRAVAFAWEDSNRSPLTPTDWRRLFGSGRPGRDELMTQEDWSQLAGLPDRVDVYRGVNAYSHWGGLSWTLDRTVAAHFARRFTILDPFPSIVIRGQILRHRILALFTGRTEHEIVAYPRHVYQRTLERP